MKQNIITQLKKYKKSLTDKNIRRILERYEKNYELKNVSKTSITLTKESEHTYEEVHIFENSFVNHFICERREHGIIITELEQTFDYTAYSKEEKELVHLIEKRFVLTNSKLKKLFKNINHLSIKDLYDKSLTIPIILDADMKNYFSTYVDYMIKDENGKYVYSYKLSTKAFINGNDISKLYDCINGNNRLLRVYDLYNGNKTEINQNDIQNIRKGILDSVIFDYKKTAEITEKEELLVGKVLNNNLAKELFIEKTKKKSKKIHTKLPVIDNIVL